MRLASGVTFAGGRYTLDRRLGAGGMASVWLARDERLGRRVAVKVVADTLADDEQWLTRFMREARAAGGLSHPNIVGVFDYGVEDARPYLVMEYVPGQNLAERLADSQAQAPDATRLARELLDALAHVHDAGIVHRDIKPANVLLDENERAHVTDFGIAQADDATSLTQTGMLIGTIKYLAPEVSAGRPATAGSDLYACGMVLREVAGELPEPALARLIAALTAVDPSQRPLSAAAALGLLDAPAPRDRTATTRVLGAPTTAEPAVMTATATRMQPAPPPAADRTSRSPAPPTGRPARRRAGLVAAGVITLLSVILVVVLSGGNDAARPPGAQSVPAAARASEPLDQQLDALDRIIDRAARQAPQ